MRVLSSQLGECVGFFFVSRLRSIPKSKNHYVFKSSL